MESQKEGTCLQVAQRHVRAQRRRDVVAQHRAALARGAALVLLGGGHAVAVRHLHDALEVPEQLVEGLLVHRVARNSRAGRRHARRWQ